MDILVTLYIFFTYKNKIKNAFVAIWQQCPNTENTATSVRSQAEPMHMLKGCQIRIVNKSC